MSAGEKPQGPRGRDRVIATIGIETNRLSSQDTKQLNKSAADIALEKVVERLHDQLIMDAFILRMAEELNWDDARCDLLKQHRSVRFHSIQSHEHTGLKKIITTVEIKHHHNLNIIRDTPGAKESEKVMGREKGAETEKVVETEEVNRNGERCFKRSDPVVRSSVAETHLSFCHSPVMIGITGKHSLLQPSW